MKSDFRGSFPNFYPLDEQEYRAEKRNSLKRWKTLTSTEIRRLEWLRGALSYMYQQGLSHREIADLISDSCKFKINHRTIGRMLKGEKYEDDEEEN